jgi:parallel beta-helix repeat protein
MKILVCLVLATLLLGFNDDLQSNQPRVRNVNTGKEFFSIQEAIDDPDTLDGHTILVSKGVYYENVLVYKSVSLIGESVDYTIINGSKSGDVVKITKDGARMSRFTVTQSGIADDGILVLSSHNSISNCKVSNAWIGIDVVNSKNTITNCNITGCGVGIGIYSSKNTIAYCNMTHNGRGIDMGDSKENTIASSCISLCYEGIHLYNSTKNIFIDCDVFSNTLRGIWLYYSSENAISRCRFFSNGKGILLENSNNNRIGKCSAWENGVGIALVKSLENTFINCDVSLSGYEGIRLYGSCKNIIINCSITYNQRDGVGLTSSSTNVLTNCTFTSNWWDGIFLENSHENSITSCKITFSEWNGIMFYKSSRNTITKSIILKNGDGVVIRKSKKNVITKCNISLNRYHGVYICDSSNSNRLYHNNFIDNHRNAYDECINLWDKGYFSGGNHWSDFDEPHEGAYDNNSDGRVDSPYRIPGNTNHDRYPLIEPTSVMKLISVVDCPSTAILPIIVLDRNSFTQLNFIRT